MAEFRYRGLDSAGRRLSGTITAYHRSEAASALRETCAVITRLEEIPAKQTQAPGTRRLTEKELALLCSQFSILLATGLPVIRCVQMVAAQFGDKRISAALQQTAQSIADGATLAQSFEANLPGLPRTFLETVRAGELSGTLPASFDRLKIHYEQNDKTRSRVKSALTYPSIVIVVAVIVLAVILIVAVPRFTGMFRELGSELPGITRALLAFSDFVRTRWYLPLLLAALLVGVLLLIRRSDKGRRALSDFRLSKAPLRRINSDSAAAQFADTMATMLGAGLSLPEALDATAAVIPNYSFSAAVRAVRDGVLQGRKLTDCMTAEACFPPLLTEMAAVGESTGALEDTLRVIANYFGGEVERATAKLLSLMEPVITVALAAMTVVLLLAVYLPMFSLYDSI